MVIEELRPGLYRWTAAHPEWKPDAEPGSAGDWPEEVGCVAYASPDGLVLVDPQVPAREEDAFWEAMDRLVAEHGRAVTVLTTVRWHTRSRDRFAERYGAHLPPIGEAGIAGVELRPVAGAGETLVWLPEPRALVPGDRLIGDARGGVRLCPESWIDYLPGLTLDDLRQRMRPLLELPVELLLVSHGEPVLGDGRAALAAALEG